MTLFDFAWAGVSPVLAFVIRDGAINRPDAVLMYSVAALLISVIVFQWFRISSPIASFFSMHDAVTLARACLIAVSLTAGMLFVFTRLSDAPRSIPIIHFLVLGCGLIGVRAWSRRSDALYRPKIDQPRCEELDFVIIVGATRLAWFFSKMVEELSSRELRIIGIIDERPQLVNRTVNGYTIIGLPENLPTIIDEYAIHGINITKVIVAVAPKELTHKARADVWSTCRVKGVPIEWLHETFSVSSNQTAAPAVRTAAPSAIKDTVAVGIYWLVKRVIDVIAALMLLITLLPLIGLVAVLVMADVGFPIVFWQQRIGYLGRPLRVYKFRTMRGSFDRRGRRMSEAERLSVPGRLLRGSRLDEIPQLVNVLKGNMSLIGPRPLLPVDQPKNISLRLHVRPGLTGLAQINGGTSLSADEKDALDEWYIRHASLFLDLKIGLRTIWVLINGNPRNDTQISAALAEKYMTSQGVFE
ncbi:MAG TPA: sugar transferase [Rhizomicrobium sp.]|jgi:lipopolysaccharide/colanic/teichoic acid biosynthesis glycosyltransferase|nr:sugar transferase [Rhizomicrobium sp.]